MEIDIQRAYIICTKQVVQKHPINDYEHADGAKREVYNMLIKRTIWWNLYQW
jgi:hypothetical protein